MPKINYYHETEKDKVSNRVKAVAILPSAGSGRRMRSHIEKPFIRLCGKELIFYAVKVLESSPSISEIVIAARPKNIPRIKSLIRRCRFSKVKEIVGGGRRRCDSVYNALSKINSDTDFVLIHDAARPFITERLIRKTLGAAKRYGAAISAVSVKPTVKETGPKTLFVKRTLDRRLFWEVQTPQAFRKDILLKAYRGYKAKGGYSYTDDASLIENMGRRVRIVEGSYSNIKITTPEDLIMAEAILETKNSKLKTKN